MAEMNGKQLNILIKAVLDEQQFKSDVESQISKLQNILDDKKLKVSVDFGENSIKSIEQSSKNLGNNVQQSMKASQQELEKYAKTVEKLKKEMEEIKNSNVDAVKRERQQWEQVFNDSIWGKMKEFGVRRPLKGEQYYSEFMDNVPESIRKNKNYWKAGSQTKYNSIDQFLKEAGLEGSMNPIQLLEEMRKGVPQFDSKLDINPDTLKGIQLGEQRIKEINSEVEKLESAIKDQISLTGKATENIENQTREIRQQADEVEKVASAWKRVQVATTMDAEGNNMSRVIKEQDQLGNSRITRQVPDESDNGRFVDDTQTYINSYKEIDLAREKFGLKHEKWSDRIAELNYKAFQMNGNGSKGIEDMTKQLSKMDSTTEKIDFEKFEAKLKKLEKGLKSELDSYKALESQREKLREQGRKLQDDGVITEKQLSEINKHLNRMNLNDRDDSDTKLKQIQDEMNLKEKVIKAQREEDRIRKVLDQNAETAQQKELKRIAQLEKSRLNYIDKIKDYSAKGLLNSDRETMYTNTANKAVSNEDLSKLDRYFNTIDRIVKKEKARTSDLNAHMNVQKKLNNTYDQTVQDTEKVSKAKDKLLKKIRDLGATGKSSIEKLQRIGKAINTSDSIDELQKLEAKIDGIYTNEKKMKAQEREMAQQIKLNKLKEEYYEKIKKYEAMGLGSSRADMYKNSVNKGEFEKVDKYFSQIDKYMKKQKEVSIEQDRIYNNSVKLSKQDAIETEKITAKKEQLRKKLVQLAMSGKKTKQELQDLARSVNNKNADGKYLDNLERKINGITTAYKLKSVAIAKNNEKMSQEIARIKDFKQSNNGLLNVTDVQIQQALRLNSAIGKRKIIATSVDRVTGAWSATIKENGRQERVLRGEIDKTNGAIKQQGELIRDTSARNLGFLQQFQIAMSRTVIWAGAMTAIYGTQRALEQMVTTIIEVDTQMTELKRVMSSDTDFNGMLEESVNLSKELGNNLTDVNNAMIGFARQGYEAQEALAMTKTAIIASNVSELTADEAMENLTAIMVQFNIEAEESIRIIDALNEVDNNFAITTKDLSDAVSKAGATAQTFGVDLEKMIGQVTAIGVATRESGSIVGNSLKTIYSRLTTMDESVDALSAVGISIKDSAGDMRSAGDILDELSTKWSGLSDEQRQNTAVSLAGRYQLSRFLALMNNYQMGLEATETALNSQGSAVRENQAFLESMQAQINQLKTAWVEMSLAFGDAILEDAFLGIVNLLKSMAESTTAFVDKFGVLGALFGTVATAIALYNIRGLQALTWSRTMTVATGGLSASMTMLSRAIGFVTANMRGLLISTGIGAVFVAIGFAVEKLISHFSELKKEQQAFEQEQTQIGTAFLDQKDKINGLVDEYQRLTDIKQRTSEEEQKYKEVQRELSQLLPNLTQEIDEQGNVILKKADALQEELKYAKELADLEREKRVVNADKDFGEQAEERAKALKEIARIEKEIKDIQSGNVLVTKSSSETYFSPDKEEELNKLEFKLRALQQTVSRTNDTVKKNLAEITKSILEIDGIEVDENVSKILEELYSLAETKDLSGDGLTALANQVATAVRDLENASNGTSLQGITIAESNLRKLLSTLGMSESMITNFINNLYGVENALSDTNVQITQASDLFSELTVEYDKVGQSVSVYNQLLHDMADGKKITAHEAMELIAKEHELASAIEIENGMVKVNIDAVESMRDAKVATFNTIIEARRADLQAQAETLKAKLNNYGIEIKAIKNVADAQRELANLKKQKNEKLEGMQSVQFGLMIKDTYDEAIGDVGAIMNSFQAIESLKGLAQSSTGLKSFGTPSAQSKAPKKSSGSKNSPSKEREIDKHTTDKYKESMSELNLELEKSEQKMTKLSKTSSGYRKELNNQYNIVSKMKKETNDEIYRLNKRNEAIEKALKSYSGKSWNSLSEESKEKFNKLSQELEKNKETVSSLTSTYIGFSNQLNSITFEKVQAIISQFEGKIDNLDYNIERSQKVMQTYNTTSKEYVKELQDQKKWLEEKAKATLDERNEITKMLKLEGLSAEQKDELREKLEELSLAYWDVNLQIKAVNESIEDQKWEELSKVIEEIAKKVDDLDHSLEISNQKMGLLKEGSKEYRDELRKQTKLYKEKQLQVEKEISYINKQLKSESLSVEQKEELREKLEELTEEWYSYENQIKDVNDAFNDIIIETMEKQKEVHISKIREELENIEKQMEKNIETTEKQYDLQIEKQREKLENLEEEIEKEDRLQQLREINEEIEKTKADKRFSYITESGEEILTYNKGRVNELEKQRNDMVKQFEREDLKKSIQDEIDRLEKAKNDKIEIMRQELQQIQESYNERIEKTEEHWENLILSVQEGTVGMDEVLNGWYSTALEDLKAFGEDVESQVKKIRESFESIAQMKNNPPSASNGGGKTPTKPISPITKPGMKQKQPIFTIPWVIGKAYSESGLQEYHDGGVVGESSSRISELANKFFNTNADEQVIKALKGEVFSPSKNIAGKFLPNMRKIMSSQQPNNIVTNKNFNFKDITIKANNAQEFLSSIEFLVKSEG